MVIAHLQVQENLAGPDNRDQNPWGWYGIWKCGHWSKTAGRKAFKGDGVWLREEGAASLVLKGSLHCTRISFTILIPASQPVWPAGWFGKSVRQAGFRKSGWPPVSGSLATGPVSESLAGRLVEVALTAGWCRVVKVSLRRFWSKKQTLIQEKALNLIKQEGNGWKCRLRLKGGYCFKRFDLD